MADLVSARSGQRDPRAGFVGASNVTQSNIPARTNAEYLGYSGWTDGALASTGVAFAVPVFIDPGTVVTNVSMVVGATAASLPTNSFAALYSGTNVAAPPLIIQSTSGGSLPAFTASTLVNFALSTPTIITPAQAPYGWIYVAVSITATTICTAAAVSTPTATGYQAFTSSTTPAGTQPFLSLTAGSALGATAAATLASPTAKAVAPIVFLT